MLRTNYVTACICIVACFGGCSSSIQIDANVFDRLRSDPGLMRLSGNRLASSASPMAKPISVDNISGRYDCSDSTIDVRFNISFDQADSVETCQVYIGPLQTISEPDSFAGFFMPGDFIQCRGKEVVVRAKVSPDDYLLVIPPDFPYVDDAGAMTGYLYKYQIFSLKIGDIKCLNE